MPLLRVSKDRKFLDETTISSLFSNVDAILSFNKDLHTTLSERLSSWEKEEDTSQHMIGDIFIKAVRNEST